MSGVKPDPHFGVGLGFDLALEPLAEGFLERVGESITGGDEHAPTAASGVQRNLGRDLEFAHVAIFFENLDGEIDLGVGLGAVELRGNCDGPKDGARLAGVGGGDVHEHPFIAVVESLANGGEVGEVATLLTVMGALEFAGLFVRCFEGRERGVHLKSIVVDFDIHFGDTHVGGFAEGGAVGEGKVRHVEVVFNLATEARFECHGRPEAVAPLVVFELGHFG